MRERGVGRRSQQGEVVRLAGGEHHATQIRADVPKEERRAL